MRLLFTHFLILISCCVSGQEITGKWYSEDSTRIYQVYKKDDEFEAVLKKSSRKTDTEGVIILRHVTSSGKNREFEGAIYTASGIPTLAKITFEKDGRVL